MPGAFQKVAKKLMHDLDAPVRKRLLHQTSAGFVLARRAMSCACRWRALAVDVDALMWLRLSSCLYIRSLARRRSDFFDFLAMCIPHTNTHKRTLLDTW